jgi:hypothetical protein
MDKAPIKETTKMPMPTLIRQQDRMTQKLPKALMMPGIVLPSIYLPVSRILRWHRRSVSCYPSHKPCSSRLTDRLLDKEWKRARTVAGLSRELGIQQLRDMLQRFLFQVTRHDDPRDPDDVPLEECPFFDGRVNVFNSATAVFYAPSDISGIGGMKREIIRSCPSWRNGGPRHDCALVYSHPGELGMRGLDVVRILAFFTFRFHTEEYPCAVVRKYRVSDEADEDTGMWVARPAYDTRRRPKFGIIHLDTVYRAAHLIPVYDNRPISLEIQADTSYDSFRTYYINKYADHHMFKITS